MDGCDFSSLFFQARTKGVEFFACEIRGMHTDNVEWKGVKQINNIIYTRSNIDRSSRPSINVRVWQSYRIGVGKYHEWSDLDSVVATISHLHVTNCKNASSPWIIDSYESHGMRQFCFLLKRITDSFVRDGRL